MSTSILPVQNQNHTQAQPPPAPPSTAAPSETMFSPPAVEPRSGSLPDRAKEPMLASARQMEDSGASAEEVQAFMMSEMEANGADSDQRTGQFIDVMI